MTMKVKTKPSRGWILWKAPAQMVGADQLRRGPYVTEGVLKGWIWCVSRRSDPHPGGWPEKVEEVYAFNKLPAWAKQLMREDRRRR